MDEKLRQKRRIKNSEKMEKITENERRKTETADECLGPDSVIDVDVVSSTAHFA